MDDCVRVRARWVLFLGSWPLAPTEMMSCNAVFTFYFRCRVFAFLGECTWRVRTTKCQLGSCFSLVDVFQIVAAGWRLEGAGFVFGRVADYGCRAPPLQLRPLCRGCQQRRAVAVASPAVAVASCAVWRPVGTVVCFFHTAG